MTSKTLAYAYLEGCIIYVGAKRTPTDADWDDYIAFLKPLLGQHDMNRCLVFERGPGPSASQRKKLQAVTRGHQVRVAVVVTSALARGVVTALSWTTPGYKAFSPKELGAALSYLGYEANAAIDIQSAVAKLQHALDEP